MANITLTNDITNNLWTYSGTLIKKNNTKLTLKTSEKYIDKDIKITLGVQEGALSVTGGGLTASTGYSSLSSDGYYNGSSYDTSDKIDITSQTSAANGYYKITTSGYGKVTRGAISKQVTTAGWLDKDDSAVSQIASSTGTSNPGTKEYYIKKATTSKSNGTATATASAGTASISKNPTASTSATITKSSGLTNGYYTDSTASDYYITVSASASAVSGVVTATGGSASASVTASSATVGVGYNPSSVTVSTTASSTGNKTGNTATTTEKTSSSSKNETIYLKPATFANKKTDGVTYTDITSTAPILIPNSYLYINAGYTPNVMITTAKLVPDVDSTKAAGASHILSGKEALDSDGTILVGTMASLAATTYNVSKSDRIIAAGKYLSGAQTIRAVTTSNISAENIKDGTVITVGDSDSAGRIENVTGTFTDSSTVTDGQTAATASQILSGYSAWVDGAEVLGNIEIGSATTPATTITVSPTFTISNSGVINITCSGSQSITPTIESGYITEGTAGTVSVTGRKSQILDSATADITGTIIVNPTTSISGSKVSFTNNDTGISISSQGGGTAIADVIAKTKTVGHSGPVNRQLGSKQILKETSTYTTATRYLQGVKVTEGKSFIIDLPNGNNGDRIQFEFSVDNNNNVTIQEPSTPITFES